MNCRSGRFIYCFFADFTRPLLMFFFNFKHLCSTAIELWKLAEVFLCFSPYVQWFPRAFEKYCLNEKVCVLRSQTASCNMSWILNTSLPCLLYLWAQDAKFNTLAARFYLITKCKSHHFFRWTFSFGSICKNCGKNKHGCRHCDTR